MVSQVHELKEELATVQQRVMLRSKNHSFLLLAMFSHTSKAWGFQQV